MQFWQQRMRVFSLVMLSVLTVVGLTGANEAPILEDPFISRQFFLEMSAYSAVKDTFQELQLEHLNHPVDRQLRALFLSHPLLQEIYMSLVQTQDLTLEQFTKIAETNMLGITNGLTLEYDVLDQTVRETATDLGFSKEAVESRRIYIQPGGNAFTVSGSQNKIIVVIQSDLLGKMTVSELRAVLGHEMGHIRSGHTISGSLLQLLIGVVGSAFVEGKSLDDAAGKVAEHFSIFGDLCSTLGPETETCHGRHQRMAMKEASRTYGLQQAKKLNDPRAEILQASMARISSLPAEAKRDLLEGFLRLIVESLRAMGAPAKSVEYFSVLYRNIPSIGVFRVDVQEFAAQVEVALNVFSRVHETSADHYGASVVTNGLMASAFAKLVGLTFKPENRKAIFKQFLKQAGNFYSQNDPEARAPFLGNSHPAIALRIAEMLNFPAYPAILFASPFLRLLLLEEAMTARRNQLEQFVAQMKEPEQSAQVKTLAESYLEPLAKLRTGLVKSIIRLGFIKRTKAGEIAGGQNPRFDNLLQYVLAQKEAKLIYIKTLEEQSKGNPDPNVAPQVANARAAIEKNMRESHSELLMAVAAEIHVLLAKETNPEAQEILKGRLQLMALASNPAATIEQLHELRTQLTTSRNGVIRKTRIPIDLFAPRCKELLQ